MRIGTFIEYRGYTGSIEYDDGVHHGRILNIVNFANYTADSLVKLFNEYISCVDDYIEFLDDLEKTNKSNMKLENNELEKPVDIDELIQSVFEDLKIFGISPTDNTLTTDSILVYKHLCFTLRHSTYGISGKHSLNPDQIKIAHDLEKSLMKLRSLMINRVISKITK